MDDNPDRSAICNISNHTTAQEAIRRALTIDRNLTGSLPPQPCIFPDYATSVIHVRDGERTLSMMRWGMPSSQKALFDAMAKRADKLRAKGKPVDVDTLLRMEPDGGTTIPGIPRASTGSASSDRRAVARCRSRASASSTGTPGVSSGSPWTKVGH